MKKLIGLLIILLFTANLFGESVFNMFLCDAQYVTTGDGMLKAIREHAIVNGKLFTDPAKDYNNNDWGYGVVYQFVVNGKQYLVSYEQCEACKNIKNGETKQRNLYLYRWDSIEWNIAVDKPLRVDIFGYDENWNLTCDCYFPQMHGGNMDGRKNYKGIFDSKYDGNIKKLDNGNIEIKLTIFIAKSTQNISDYKYHSEIITLKPCGDNNYKVK
jgi:hypothetical protein